MSREAAFFDLDKTLMAGSSGMQFAKAARERGLISRAQIFRWGRDHIRYRIKGATDDETSEILKVARETLSGVAYLEISRMWPEVLAGILPRIYPEVLSEVHRHQDEGRLTYIVSAAGSDMVESLAQVLGMDGGIGTKYVVENGAYTGGLDGPFVYGRGKVVAIENLGKEIELDLEGSWAYSDSASDLPMMELVGNAVAVNPDAPLLEKARLEGWKVMRFDRLGRNLAIGGTVAGALLVGGIGGWLSKRRTG
ncbi:MAG: HAD-IB family hydrolase [Solirubrobacterales bacterium]|nr:HAD-IB family hydrolase [Solirubrobacterales bacterium]HMT04656.1 HAD-IB family hydrolase [Solirubrobacterales bacterium]